MKNKINKLELLSKIMECEKLIIRLEERERTLRKENPSRNYVDEIEPDFWYNTYMEREKIVERLDTLRSIKEELNNDRNTSNN